MENIWKGGKETVISTCQKMLSLKQLLYNAISNSRTKAEKIKTQTECKDVIKKVKRDIRIDKRKCVEDLPETVKKASRE
ncbi:unnamed protein product [Schistosoma margrebowiei]|uniref:Uncharacterized protein n=1 Tax=Schistosoma margrebowiei TaxID=48269 RepID=A0A183LQE5_9TREM|nr:unnamed protein product [Schistosoma margrebowiei]